MSNDLFTVKPGLNIPVEVLYPTEDDGAYSFWAPRECDLEFGDHVHDDAECARMLDVMGRVVHYDDGYAEAHNRSLEEDRLGRPLFPNEY